LVDYTSQDDEKLIALVAEAHSGALAELYDRYGRLVFSIAVHITGERSVAEEIALDVFTRLWQKADTYRPELGRPRPWLTSIARHEAIDTLRRRGRRPEGQSDSWDMVPEGQQQSVDQGEDNPERLAELALRRERIQKAMAQLPAEQQQVVELAYFGGYSQRQIADTLQQPVGTVKTRIRLAMEKLRRLLDSLEGGE
jgi:RNA polymerase sigma-70 factor (ECF subfamily)